MSNHIPVMLDEVIQGLNIRDNGIYLDLTLGRGGHSKEILRRVKKGKLICFDKDLEAIKESESILSDVGHNFELIHDDFRNFKKYMCERKITYVDGILLDLGVSSPQFDNPSRGFSYREDAKLDMRMNTDDELTAYDIVNKYSFDNLVKIFNEYGEDKYSYNVAKNIVKYREIKPIETTLELVDIIKKSKPMKELNKKGHPAKQIFQTLRIEVNDELGALKEVLNDATTILNKSGRLAIITFHSLEDKIVKKYFLKLSKIEGDRMNDFIKPEDIPKASYKLVNNKVIIPTKKELNINLRSKSAKLRIIERISI